MTVAARELAGGTVLPRLAAPLTIAATFLSAALLFSIQPMFTKLVLPVLGGSPSVWSVATVFFQAVLLGGYAYAHLLMRFARPRAALAIHLSLLALAWVMLPIALPPWAAAPPAAGHTLWLLGLFALVVGLPFFALSANGPLLQALYARTDLPAADNPYFLYSASNIGSFAALLAYPLLIEPLLGLGKQTTVWALGFVLLALLIAGSGTGLVSRGGVLMRPRPAFASRPLGLTNRLAIVLLALVPSALLVSVTAHISTDIAAVPLLWVVPLALFLLTFVIAFSDRNHVSSRWLLIVQVGAIALAFLSFVFPLPLSAGVAVHLLAFFTSALLCHGAIYARRPEPARLTEFYLLISLGGCLGGVLAALVAPALFSTILEYPLLLVLALFCRPRFFEGPRTQWLHESGRTLVVAALVVIAASLLAPFAPAGLARLLAAAFLALVLVLSVGSPRQLAPVALALALVAAVLPIGGAGPQSFRSFFGVHRLAESPDGRFLTLSHGTTIHGATRLRNDDGTPAEGAPEPLTYYTREGGMGSAISALRDQQGGTLSRVAVIGLGSGSLACHAAPGETWSFYEIDPAVAAIAADPAYFRFLAECTPNAPVVIGDARLTFAARTEPVDLLVIDAFSSDSIPAHLVTVEALGLYLDRLAPGGAILIHITNRNLDLSRILARTAAAAGLATYLLEEREAEPFETRYRARTDVVALARRPEDLGALASTGAWQRLAPDLSRRPWSDDWSNIVEALLDRMGRPRP